MSIVLVRPSGPLQAMLVKMMRVLQPERDVLQRARDPLHKKHLESWKLQQPLRRPSSVV